MTSTQKELADRLFPKSNDLTEYERDILNVPPENRRLHTETADLTISSIHSYLENGKIEIPEFQRGYVWTRPQASRLIESLLIQCPIPVVYFSESSEGTLLVIDGNQRLLSIRLFLDDAFDLQGLTTYPELNGQTWSTLDPRFKNHILNRTIRCITILKETHPQIKFDVFERLNTGSVKLNAQELRHGINYGPLMNLLDELGKNETWKKLSGIKTDKRMRGAELILRFFAFSQFRDEYEKPLSSFLDKASSRLRFVDSEGSSQMTRSFERTIARIDKALGKDAFRMLGDGKKSPPLNAAIFDAEMIGFLETKNKKIIEGDYDPNALRNHVSNLLNDEAYNNYISRATSDETSVARRIEGFKTHLNAF